MTRSAQPPEETFCLTCGPGAAQLETLPARKLTGRIRFCTLDCPDTVLAGRPPWRGTGTEDAIARHQRFAVWLRAHIQPCYDTSQLTPDQTAERIATWIRQSMDDTDDPFWPGW